MCNEFIPKQTTWSESDRVQTRIPAEVESMNATRTYSQSYASMRKITPCGDHVTTTNKSISTKGDPLNSARDEMIVALPPGKPRENVKITHLETTNTRAWLESGLLLTFDLWTDPDFNKLTVKTKAMRRITLRRLKSVLQNSYKINRSSGTAFS